MKILHITPHLGGGVGTVVMDWIKKDKSNSHSTVLLDTANPKAKLWAADNKIDMLDGMGDYPSLWFYQFGDADIVVCHYWDHPMLAKLFADEIPPCRLVFWCHKNITATMFNPVWWDRVLNYPDLFLDTSPIQGCGCDFIWSTGDMSRFLEIKPKPHEGFNVGYVGTCDYKKIHSHWLNMCLEIADQVPEVHFIVVGENNMGGVNDDLFTFTGKVDDVAPYLAEMDVFGYPLRPDHYGTCEQSLGEAMAAGVVPVAMDNPAERTIINHRKDGLIASSEDKYVKFIKHLYDYPDTRAIMSDLARERSKKLYSIDTMIKSWNEVFDEMMTQPKKSRPTL